MKMLFEFDYKKATQAINYFTREEGGQIDKLKLIKLIYFADRYHLRRYGRPIVNDTYFAMRLGPVGSSAKDIIDFSAFLDREELDYASKYLARGKQNNTIVSILNVDSDIFSKSEIESLKFSYNNFGKHSSINLVNLVHLYPEWYKFKNNLQSKETTREPMSYLDFFKNPNNRAKDQFALAKDILSASKEIFEEDYEIAEYWK